MITQLGYCMYVSGKEFFFLRNSIVYTFFGGLIYLGEKGLFYFRFGLTTCGIFFSFFQIVKSSLTTCMYVTFHFLSPQGEIGAKLGSRIIINKLSSFIHLLSVFNIFSPTLLFFKKKNRRTLLPFDTPPSSLKSPGLLFMCGRKIRNKKKVSTMRKKIGIKIK